MYQTKFFHTIFFTSVFLLCFGTFSEANVIDFDPEGAKPQITGSGSYQVEEEITSGKKRWPVTGSVISGPAEVSVTISVSASGLGYGQATFSPVNIVGQNYKEYADNAIDVGKTRSTGGWDHGTATVKTVIKEAVPSVHKKSYPWSAEGKVVLTPNVWRVSVTKGGGIRWPLQVQGTMTITGEWDGYDKKSIPRWAPSGTQGSHDRKLTYYCGACLDKGDTLEAMGGKAAHAIVTCKRPGCGDKYHACNKFLANIHSFNHDTNRWNCDPLSVSYNKTSFKSDEQVVVTIVRPDIRSAYLFIDGENTTSGVSNGSDTIKLTSGFPDLDFSESNEWYGNATLYISYKDKSGVEYWTYHYQYISVEKAYTSSTGNKPDPPASFSVSSSSTWYRGQIRLTWTKSDSDGGSEITDYQYQLSYYKKSSGEWTDWPDDDSWESAGTDRTELISGLRKSTRYRVRMRAVNDDNESSVTSPQMVTTK